MPRFVVLEHRWEGVHDDLMFEVGGTLKTWSIDSPLELGVEVPARIRADHRTVYLDYEGPVSGNRGHVTRRAGGVYRVIEWSDRRIDLVIESPQLTGKLRLVEGDAGGWTVLFLPGNAD